MTRVAQNATSGSATSATLNSAGRQTVSFQVVVAGGASGVSNVNLSAGAFTGPNGASIPASAVSLYREWYVSFSTGTPNFGGSNPPLAPGSYPDALIPFVNPDTGQPLSGGTYQAANQSVAAGKQQPYWVDVAVPANQTAGTYTGSISVTTSQGTVAVPVTLNVWGFSLPLHPALRTAFQNWSLNTGIDKVLLANRLSPTNPPASQVSSYSTQLGLNTSNLGYWSGGNNSTCSMSSPPSASTLSSAASSRSASGVLLYNYSADEISQCGNPSSLTSSVQAWARNLHQAGIQQLVTSEPSSAWFTDGAGGHGVDIWVELPNMYQDNPSLTQQAIANGMSAWSYNDMNQDSYSPKWEIDFPPIDFAVQGGFINQALGMTGLLYWKVDGWTSDPWHNVDTYQGAYPGEGMLVYPGSQVGLSSGAVASMRLKYLRDGVNNYDYVQIAKRHGHAKQAMRIVHSVAHDFAHWHHNPAALQRAELQLGRLNSK